MTNDFLFDRIYFHQHLLTEIYKPIKIYKPITAGKNRTLSNKIKTIVQFRTQDKYFGKCLNKLADWRNQIFTKIFLSNL